MIAPAAGAARRGVRRPAASGLALCVGLSLAAPATADIGGRLSIASEETFRGRSLSAGRPAIGLDLAYDDVRGPYMGVQAKAMLLPGGDPAFLSAQGYAGYALRLRSGLTLDLGASHTRFSYHSRFGRGTGYSEVSVGLLGRRTSARLSLSPDWLGRGNYTAYAEMAHAIDLPAQWRLTVHGGLLTWLGDDRPEDTPRLRYDARLGASRRFGRVRIEAGWTVGGPRVDRYRGGDHGHHILTIGAALGI